MTLHKRLAKLEAKRHRMHGGPRIILFNTCWRDAEGNLQSIAKYAKVLTASGWQTINRDNHETDANFQIRAEAMAA